VVSGAKSIIDGQIVGGIVYVRQAMFRNVLIMLLMPASAWTADTNRTATGVAEFTAAYQAWDGTGFAKAAKTFTQAPVSCTNQYWCGTAEFHRGLCLLGEPASTTDRQASARALEEAVRALRRAVELDPANGENHALLSTAYGLSIAANPARALWLGPRVTSQEKQARKLSPDNPRVFYLAGMNRFYGPALLGGKEEGLVLLLAAQKLFETEAAKPAGPVEPRWGRSTCLVYIGKTYAALGKPAEAEEYFRNALTLNPQDKLARSELEKRRK
jgi:tetratricopeptide (TPR) repeat protein